MDEKSKLNDEIEELRKMLNIPKLYLSNYFSDIKSKIDLHYAKTFESDKETWVQLIEKVEVYENEFLRKFKLNDQLKAELSEEIEEIRTRINEANFKEIENMTEKLKRILLTDKTFLLMNLTNLHKKDEKDPNIRLALVYANKYLNEEKIEKLKEEDNSVITNESIKLKKLREFILQSDQMLIKLDFKIINSIDLSKNFKDSLTNKNIITSDLFKDFIGLEFLSLANNSINSIESNTFQGLKNLKYLFLNNNQLKEINDAIFTGLINLKSLNISKNKISTIKFENFKDLVNLQQLNLSNNNLVTNNEFSTQRPNSTTDIKMNSSNDSSSTYSLSNNTFGTSAAAELSAVYWKSHNRETMKDGLIGKDKIMQLAESRAVKEARRLAKRDLILEERSKVQKKLESVEAQRRALIEDYKARKSVKIITKF